MALQKVASVLDLPLVDNGEISIRVWKAQMPTPRFGTLCEGMLTKLATIQKRCNYGDVFPADILGTNILGSVLWEIWGLCQDAKIPNLTVLFGQKNLGGLLDIDSGMAKHYRKTYGKEQGLYEYIEVQQVMIEKLFQNGMLRIVP